MVRIPMGEEKVNRVESKLAIGDESLCHVYSICYTSELHSPQPRVGIKRSSQLLLFLPPFSKGYTWAQV
jgi:hypothetical protein